MTRVTRGRPRRTLSANSVSKPAKCGSDCIFANTTRACLGGSTSGPATPPHRALQGLQGSLLLFGVLLGGIIINEYWVVPFPVTAIQCRWPLTGAHKLTSYSASRRSCGPDVQVRDEHHPQLAKRQHCLRTPRRLLR